MDTVFYQTGVRKLKIRLKCGPILTELLWLNNDKFGYSWIGK